MELLYMNTALHRIREDPPAGLRLLELKTTKKQLWQTRDEELSGDRVEPSVNQELTVLLRWLKRFLVSSTNLSNPVNTQMA